MTIRMMLLSSIIAGITVPAEALRRRLPQHKKETHRSMTLKSTAFSNDGAIPQLYTCDGKDISPPVRWKHVPPKTKSFVLIFDDLDKPGGGKFCHWLVYNLPATVTYLPKNANIIYYKGKEGANNFGNLDWDGPCPLIKPHRYRFTLYALSQEKLEFTTKKPTRDMIVRAMEGKILGKATLQGTYDRAKNKWTV